MAEVVSGQSEGTWELTPSGIAIYFQSTPKRCYKIGFPDPNHPAEAQDWDWQEAPSVTTVLGVLDKSGPLVWWSQRVGVEGLMQLQACGKVWLNGDTFMRGIDGGKHPDLRGVCVDSQGIVDLLVEHRLSCNHVRDKAGDRGQAVHDALENWARYGHMPDPSIYPEEQEGYVRGLVAFLKDVPSAEPEGAEVLVASAEYGYAGRYDLRIRTHQPHEVVVRRTKTRVRRRELLPGRYLADLKTSRNAYPTHSLQLEAYEAASLESGYEPTDGRGVLVVSPEGTYEFRRSKASIEDFLAVLEVWRRFQNKKDWI